MAQLRKEIVLHLVYIICLTGKKDYQVVMSASRERVKVELQSECEDWLSHPGGLAL